MGVDEREKESIMRNKGMSPRFDFKQEDKRNLILLLTIGLVLRLYAFSQIYMISFDGAFQYIPVAKLFYQGEYLQGLLQPQLPLYPFLIAILSHITGDLELAGQLISIIFSLLAVFPLYLIGKFLFGPRAGFWTTILYLIHPMMLRSSVDVLKEGMVIFFFFSSVYYSLRFLQDGKRLWLFWTVAFALVGALSRIMILEILVVLGLWLGYGALRGRLRKRKLAYRYLWVVIAIVGIALILVMPGILGWEFWITKKPYQVVDDVFRRWFVYQWPHLSQIGVRVLHIIGRFIDKTYLLIFPIALFGLGWRMRAREFSAEERYLILLMVILIVSFFPSLYASGRYYLPAVFLLYLWAGFGFVKIRELIDSRFTRYPKLTAIIPIMVLLIIILPISLRPQRLDKIGRKEVGLWLREQAPSSPLILTNIPRVAYYARGEYVAMPPEATSKNILNMGRSQRVDYVVIEQKERDITKSLIPFDAHEELELVHRHSYGHEGRVIYVFKMRKQIGRSQKAS